MKSVDKTKFSVIVPLYNKSVYVVKAVTSVLQQNYREFELLVVDDGSTDDGLERVRSLADERIRIVTQSNSGAAAARNRGVREAVGDWIAFLDADDWWEERYLEEMRRLITEYPGAGLYGCNYYYVKNGKCRVEAKGFADGFQAGYIDYFKAYADTFCMTFTSSSWLLMRNVFEEFGGFNEKLKFGEDFDLWARIALKYKIAYVNRPLAYYNQDVDQQNRAVGSGKTYDRGSHFIFNLGELEKEESVNPDLKKLLDGLRVRTLLPYYLNRREEPAVQEQLAKVAFNRQPLYYRLLYGLPRFVSRFFWTGKRWGSRCKRACIVSWRRSGPRW